MSNYIAALETPYKGFKFRSRLEARWGVFYDQARIPWSYENDPVTVDGINYLPDFRVNIGDGQTIIHEVKASHEVDRIRPLYVYLAGKMKPAHDWRGAATPLGREIPRGVDDYAMQAGPFKAWWNGRYTTRFEHTDITVVGPLPTGCDHGCGHQRHSAHMSETCSTLDLGNVVIACYSAIQYSEIVCAHINTLDCYGTLVEIGMARALHKTLSVTLDKALADRLTIQPDNGTIGRHDLWFAMEAAMHSAIVEDDAAAREFHSSVIRDATAKEYRTISGIGASGQTACMTFGDPIDLMSSRRAHQWGADLIALCQRSPEAANYARSYRFT